MKKLFMSVLVLLTADLWPLISGAQAPQLINYQGRLLNGTNLVNGNVGLSLRLFNVQSGGTVQYEDSNTVTVVDGLYSTLVGDNPTNAAFLSALTNAAVWIEVAVDGSTLAPRERLVSVGYSLSTRGILATTNGGFVFNPSENALDPKSHHSTIAGGQANSIQTNSEFSTISGGSLNSIDAFAPGSVIAGGQQNSIMRFSTDSVIAGGNRNSIQTNADYCFIGGGADNEIQLNGFYNFIVGGQYNKILNGVTYSFIGGGDFNSIETSANGSFVGGGELNYIRYAALLSFIGGGRKNQIQTNGDYSVLAGGEANTILQNAHHSFLGGGYRNEIGTNSYYSVIAGGSSNNVASDSFGSTIGGGLAHDIGTNAAYTTIAGGYDNNVGDNSPYSVVAGGRGNIVGAGAANSFAAGRNAQANHSGTFVWADNNTAIFGSSAANQFLIRAAGGVGINVTNTAYDLDVGGRVRLRQEPGGSTAGMWFYQTGPAADRAFVGMNGDGYVGFYGYASSWDFQMNVTNGNVGFGTTPNGTNRITVAGGAFCSGNGTTWVNASDKNLKTGFEPIDANSVLEKVAALPLTTWHYKEESSGNKHLGPMAQDFHAAFNLGYDDKSISTVDASGVALAAIQALKKENDAKAAKIEALEKQNAEILQRLRALEAR